MGNKLVELRMLDMRLTDLQAECVAAEAQRNTAILRASRSGASSAEIADALGLPEHEIDRVIAATPTAS